LDALVVDVVGDVVHVDWKVWCIKVILPLLDLQLFSSQCDVARLNKPLSEVSVHEEDPPAPWQSEDDPEVVRAQLNVVLVVDDMLELFVGDIRCGALQAGEQDGMGVVGGDVVASGNSETACKYLGEDVGVLCQVVMVLNWDTEASCKWVVLGVDDVEVEVRLGE
jgi:hypothetical protein